MSLKQQSLTEKNHRWNCLSSCSQPSLHFNTHEQSMYLMHFRMMQKGNIKQRGLVTWKYRLSQTWPSPSDVHFALILWIINTLMYHQN